MNIDLSSLDALRPIIPIPMWQKGAAVAVAFVLILVLYIFFGWLPAQEEIERQTANVDSENQLLIKNLNFVKDLPKKQREYAELEKQLKVALSMLPKQSQIPDLLESVSWAGKDSGLEFSVFRPGKETVKQIYAEVPVDLKITGTYAQLLTFLKRVGEMPRIVDVKELDIISSQKDEGLTIAGKAVTYRFVEEKERAKMKTPRRRN